MRWKHSKNADSLSERRSPSGGSSAATPFPPAGTTPCRTKGFGRKIKYHDLDRLAKEMRENGEMTFDYDDGDGQDAETAKNAGGPAEGAKQSSEKRDKYAPKKLPKYDRDGGKPRNSEKP